jgi:hypothetical protein
MEPGNYDFTVWQGATWYREITYKTTAGVVVNLSAYSARMTIRRVFGSTPLLSLTSSPGGGIVLAATAPNMVVTITDAQTLALTFSSAVYDLVIVAPGGTVDRILQGRVSLSPEVST